MSAPRIKFHQLPAGYSEDSDTDIQSNKGDELIPFAPKLGLLSDVKSSSPLTGIVPVDGESLHCFDLDGGRHTHTLTANTSKSGRWITSTWSEVLWEPIGTLAPIIKKANGDVVAASGYMINADGITFTGSDVGTTIEAYHKASASDKQTFAFAGDTFYRGANPGWNRLLISKDNAAYAVVTPPSDGVGYITISGVSTGVKARYAYKKTKTRWFLSDHPNWIGGHIRMWPDVFVGEEDYPGDQYEDIGGTPVEPGSMPSYREPGTYRIIFRDGMVEFPAEIDGEATPVKANYAHTANILNVTGQVLDAVEGSDGKQFQANSEALFPDSHGKRWVGRNDSYLPVNIYIDGVKAPQIQTVPVFDTLSIKG